MTTPNNPGWVTGYVPTASQWNAEFASKVDYPAPVGQGGTGATNAGAGNYNLQQRQLIAATGNLAALTSYFVRTSVGAFTLYLPALSAVLPGDWLVVADVDANANNNNITITANGSDVIALYDSSAGSQVMNLAGARVTLVVNNTNWRMLVG